MPAPTPATDLERADAGSTTDTSGDAGNLGCVDDLHGIDDLGAVGLESGNRVHGSPAHLTPRLWARVNRSLVRKALAEFAHERLITPQPLDEGGYVVHSDDKEITYTFAAEVLELEHWLINADSITRWRRHDGQQLPLEAADLVLELRATLRLSEQILPTYLEEIGSTLASAAYKLDRALRDPQPAGVLARAEFQTIEAAMTEGHPCFVAGNGRLGFGTHDYLRYAPETGQSVRLVWLAAHRDHTTFSMAADLDYETFIVGELDPATRARFDTHLANLGLVPSEYYLLPAHPWQWHNKLSITFAGDIARRRLVYVGEDDDQRLPQQSIRTFFNATRPERHYVKTALSVLNMGFIRGLSADYMAATPAINDWLFALVDADETLQRAGFSVLRERAAIGYRSEQYDAVAPKGSQYRKMSAALWRESPVDKIGAGERLTTMAALLHVDPEGRSVLGALIAESGLAPTRWLRHYLDAYLTPILHCLYAHDLAFMPHGENVILVLRDGVPVRALFKDLAEEVAVMGSEKELPAAVERIRADVAAQERALTVFTDVVDCFLRFLNGICYAENLMSQEQFWSTVAACVADYQRDHPELAERFAAYDLFADDFALSCLNRLQLRDNQEMIDLTDPSAKLQFAGTLSNPLARFAPDRSQPATSTTR